MLYDFYIRYEKEGTMASRAITSSKRWWTSLINIKISTIPILTKNLVYDIYSKLPSIPNLNIHYPTRAQKPPQPSSLKQITYEMATKFCANSTRCDLLWNFECIEETARRVSKMPKWQRKSLTELHIEGLSLKSGIKDTLREMIFEETDARREREKKEGKKGPIYKELDPLTTAPTYYKRVEQKLDGLILGRLQMLIEKHQHSSCKAAPEYIYDRWLKRSWDKYQSFMLCSHIDEYGKGDLNQIVKGMPSLAKVVISWDNGPLTTKRRIKAYDQTLAERADLIETDRTNSRAVCEDVMSAVLTALRFEAPCSAPKSLIKAENPEADAESLPPSFESIIGEAHWPHLQSFTLENAEFYPSYAALFFARHKGTLNKVRLRSIWGMDFTTDACWQEVSEQLTNMRLESIELGGQWVAFDCDKPRAELDCKFTSKICADGKVHSAKRVIEELKILRGPTGNSPRPSTASSATSRTLSLKAWGHLAKRTRLNGRLSLRHTKDKLNRWAEGSIKMRDMKIKHD